MTDPALTDHATGYIPDDLWEGMTDDFGTPVEADEVYDGNIAPQVTNVVIAGATERENIVARYRLPEEFWGSRDLFKRIRQAAHANQAHPDAVLAVVLARATGAIGHEVKFDSGRGPTGTLSLYVCLLAKSGIGKSTASEAADRVIRLPRHLLDFDGQTDMEKFRDGIGIGTGEGVTEAFMGWIERDTGKMKPAKRGQAPEPETIKVRAVVRHRAFFDIDEGAVLNSLMTERKGSILGATLRTAWSGGTLGQSNARDETTRFVRRGQYALGLAIGYQPDVAVDLLADAGPGTPQRFLWFGAQDTEMPATRTPWPEPIDMLPEQCDAGVIEFPEEIKDWFYNQTRAKHLGEVEFDNLDSHEPLMRAKLTALLCYLDGRMMVSRDDWILAGMIWSVSKSIRDRLVRHRDAENERQAAAKLTARMEEAEAVELIRATVEPEVQRVARRIARKAHDIVDDFQPPPRRKDIRDNFGRDKKWFTAAEAHARAVGWLAEDDGSGLLKPGESRPA